MISGKQNVFDPLAVRFGANLRRLRSLAGMSQSELGRLLGVTFQQIQKYERGSNNVSAVTLYRLKHILGCKLDDFFVGEAPPEAIDRAEYHRQERVVCRLSRAVLAIDAPDVQERLIQLVQAMAIKA